MTNRFILHVLRWTCSLTVLWAGSVAAQPATNPALSQYLGAITETHPALQESAARLRAAQAQAEAFSKPVYNPDLVLEGEDAAERAYAIGIDQTLDFSGRRKARTRQGQAELDAARYEYALARSAVLANALRGLAAYNTQRSLTALSDQRLQVMERFANVVDRQRQAGETGLLDWQLAQQALAEAVAQQSNILAQASESEEALQQASRMPLPQAPALPALPQPEILAMDTGQRVDQHPSVRLAVAEEQTRSAAVGIAESERGIDPSIGLRAGREEGAENANLFALELSIPLFVRNNLRAEVLQAMEEQSAAQAQAQNVRESTAIVLQAAAQRYRNRYTAWQRWQTLSEAGAQSLEALDKVWQVGEINTTDYLVQLKQRLDTQAAGLELQAAVWESWVDWLDAAHAWDDWLTLPQATLTMAVINKE